MKTWLRWCGVLTVLLGSASSFAQTCPTPPASWRPPLKFFCPNQPAKADEVNANFGQVVSWLEAKVGRVDAGIELAPSSVSTPSIADDAVTSAKLAPGSVATSDLALGAVAADRVRDGGVPIYLVTNGSCPGVGLLTNSASCTRQTGVCSPVCGLNIQSVYARCDGTCDTNSPCPTSSAQCPEPNRYLGVLVP